MKNILTTILIGFSLSALGQLPTTYPAIFYSTFVGTAEVTVLYKPTELPTIFGTRMENRVVHYPTERGDFMIGVNKQVTIQDEIVKPDTFIAGFMESEPGQLMLVLEHESSATEEGFGEILHKIPLTAFSGEQCTINADFSFAPLELGMLNASYLIKINDVLYTISIEHDNLESAVEKVKAEMAKAKTSEKEKFLLATRFAFESNTLSTEAIEWLSALEEELPLWKWHWYEANFLKRLGKYAEAQNAASNAGMHFKKLGYGAKDPFYNEINEFIHSLDSDQ